MVKTSRNDPCPCGSNKKYKKCYEAKSPDCSIYKNELLKKEVEEHKKREEEVAKSILEFAQELNQLFYKTESGLYTVPSRMQLIGCFSVIDVLANYWFEYLGRKDGTQSIRFKEFVNKFCFVQENTVFKNNKNLSSISTDDFYLFRCGLVHFFGLSIPNIMILSMPQTNIEKHQSKLKKVSKNLIFIFPHEIHDLIYKSAELMLLAMVDVIKKSQTDEALKQKHIDGIKRIFEKMQKEGAIIIPKEKMEEVMDKIE